MSEHVDHGHSPAAWTAVTLLLVATALICASLLWSQVEWLLWPGLALVALGALAGPVLARLGLGSAHEAAPDTHTTAVR